MSFLKKKSSNAANQTKSIFLIRYILIMTSCMKIDSISFNHYIILFLSMSLCLLILFSFLFLNVKLHTWRRNSFLPRDVSLWMHTISWKILFLDMRCNVVMFAELFMRCMCIYLLRLRNLSHKNIPYGYGFWLFFFFNGKQRWKLIANPVKLPSIIFLHSYFTILCESFIDK